MSLSLPSQYKSISSFEPWDPSRLVRFTALFPVVIFFLGDMLNPDQKLSSNGFCQGKYLRSVNRQNNDSFSAFDAMKM